jgi:hypothetical protein
MCLCFTLLLPRDVNIAGKLGDDGVRRSLDRTTVARRHHHRIYPDTGRDNESSWTSFGQTWRTHQMCLHCAIGYTNSLVLKNAP